MHGVASLHQHQSTRIEAAWHHFDPLMVRDKTPVKVDNLPQGIVHAESDMELKPLWLTKNSMSKDNGRNHQNLLAIPAGIKQKRNVDAIVRKNIHDSMYLIQVVQFVAEKFTIILFHYDGNVNGWHDLPWSKEAIHIAATNQTKWWFAKRFLHPDVLSTYDYIFLWDEDLEVDNFHPRRYLEIMKSEGLEISQPALDPVLSEVHHKITMRSKDRRVHRKIYNDRGGSRCSDSSKGPPCSGWVEGMAPVFSKAAWRCAWHLIQNDLIHGWGLDFKLGYCAQGDRTKKVGVIDSEFVVHRGIKTLGVSTKEKKGQGARVDVRVEIRRQSKSELEIFQKRWDEAVRNDRDWIDPYKHTKSRRKKHNSFS
ncbi:hypothetical protein QJS10_CPB11g00955 [Acorus calamus]|uniref:Uncharacterized protein n=1 Tax=Acorus calamus TaxID=4465 RepID=A0AAV9DUA4_ACOCL|nr:hypothetical protein QJS10_CPB11g00955 [Acorus calamus]